MTTTVTASPASPRRTPRNKGKLIGAKPPLRIKHVWAIRSTLQLSRRIRDLALFNLGIDSKLRGCDLVSLRVTDVAPQGRAIARTTVRQKKTGRVMFELTEHTREAVDAYLRAKGRHASGYLFPGRGGVEPHMSTRQYARLLDGWLHKIGLDPALYGTHSLRRTKATLIYKRTGNLRAVQLLLETTTNCAATLDRGENLLSLPSAPWGDGADRAAADSLRRRAGGHRPARWIAGPAPCVDAA
jgi:integrase